ncbi:MAG: winged helix-turn-helix domain-containing protein, partial [Chloroflexota bacterium]
KQIQPEEFEQILSLTGGYPSLIKAICEWWLLEDHAPDWTTWRTLLQREPSIQNRLNSIWKGLTEGEKQALMTLQRIGQTKIAKTSTSYQSNQFVWQALEKKGLCQNLICPSEEDVQLKIFGELFIDYIGTQSGTVRGQIYLDQRSQIIYHHEQELDSLTPIERRVLLFLLKNPRKFHTYTQIFQAGWPDEEMIDGASTESIQQMIRSLRLKIEPNPSQPVYIINRRGRRSEGEFEGGYLFYPEGRPS